jgi:hypothetical protein
MSVFINPSPNKLNFMSQVMGRINIDRQLKIISEEGASSPEQIENLKEQFSALEDSIPASERQKIANLITTLV